MYLIPLPQKDSESNYHKWSPLLTPHRKSRLKLETIYSTSASLDFWQFNSMRRQKSSEIDLELKMLDCFEL